MSNVLLGWPSRTCVAHRVHGQARAKANWKLGVETPCCIQFNYKQASKQYFEETQAQRTLPTLAQFDVNDAEDLQDVWLDLQHKSFANVNYTELL